MSRRSHRRRKKRGPRRYRFFSWRWIERAVAINSNASYGGFDYDGETGTFTPVPRSRWEVARDDDTQDDPKRIREEGASYVDCRVQRLAGWLVVIAAIAMVVIVWLLLR